MMFLTRPQATQLTFFFQAFSPFSVFQRDFPSSMQYTPMLCLSVPKLALSCPMSERVCIANVVAALPLMPRDRKSVV